MGAGRGLVIGDLVNQGNVHGDSSEVKGRLVFETTYTNSNNARFKHFKKGSGLKLSIGL